jgi:branched-chain amino acid transport system ATP-binding protein
MMLRVESINTFYGSAQILFDLTLAVKSGEVVALLGRNGAGKTTTFKSIMGIVALRRGTIYFKDQAIQSLAAFKICALGLGYVPQDRRIFKRLTVIENLEVGRQPSRKGFKPWTPERLFQLFPNLAERRYDEPSEGLAPVIVKQLAQTIRKIKSEGISVLMAEQNLNFARSICDRACIVYQGSIRYQSAIDDLSQEVYEKYCAL